MNTLKMKKDAGDCESTMKAMSTSPSAPLSSQLAHSHMSREQQNENALTSHAHETVAHSLHAVYFTECRIIREQ